MRDFQQLGNDRPADEAVHLSTVANPGVTGESVIPDAGLPVPPRRSPVRKFVPAALAILVVAALAYLAVGLLKPAQPSPNRAPAVGDDQSTGDQKPVPGASAISCQGTEGPDVTTTSKSFVDVNGTTCTYKVGSTDETLVLSGKLTGRNTEGTGMSATLNVDGTDCVGGETLNYSRTYTPMYSTCTFEVKADSTVTIKWRYLSPFGATAAVLRSSKNIAPSITGIAIPDKDANRL